MRGTRLAELGTCFVAQASNRAERNHVFVQEGGQWRVVTPTRPTVGPGPQTLETLVRRASRIPNAEVQPDGRLVLRARDQ